MSGEGVLSSRRSDPAFQGPASRFGQAVLLRDLTLAARAVVDAFRAQYEAGAFGRQEHASLYQLKTLLDNSPGLPGAVVADARESAGERPPGPSLRDAGQRAADPAADSSPEARP